MKQKIMVFISDKNGCRTAEVAKEMSLTSYQARYYLQWLEKEGKIARSPLRRGAATRWETSTRPGPSME